MPDGYVWQVVMNGEREEARTGQIEETFVMQERLIFME